MTTISNSSDLMAYLTQQMEASPKMWFGYAQQRITGVKLAHEIAARHADVLTPDEVCDYVVKLNNAIHAKIVRVC